MADTAIAITAGTGTNVDTRTEGTNGNHRQVVVLGDPATNDGVAAVDPSAGLKVNLGADNDVTLATLPDTAGGDLAAIATDAAAIEALLTTIDTDTGAMVTDLAAIEVLLGTIDADTGAIATDAAAIEVLLTAMDADTSAIAGAVSGTEMQVDVVTSALPSGASTSAKQDTIIGHVDGIETLLGTIDTDTGNIATLLGTIDTDTGAMATDLAAIEVLLTQMDADTSALVVDAAASEALLITIDADTSAINTSAAALANVVTGEYETVAASQTNQVLGPTGATGDYLSHLLVVPATVSPGLVTILDNATSINVFAGGTDSLTTLHPFTIDIRAKSVSGSWRVTTGANVSVFAVGSFT